MKKNSINYIIILLILILVLLFISLFYVTNTEDVPLNTEKIEKQTTQVRKETVIEYNKTYQKYISNLSEAQEEIKKEGIRQREKYSNQTIKEMEKKMELDYGILAVNFGELGTETAVAIEEAFEYMFQKFPQLKGTITNVSLANFPKFSENLAITEDFEFITHSVSEDYPKVNKSQILLNSRGFLNEIRMDNIIKNNIKANYWPQNSNIQSVIVHELAHSVVDLIAKRRYGLENSIYITQENYDSYIKYKNDKLAMNQTTAKEILEHAYNKYNSNVSFEDFRSSISKYALGLQKDGGYSYAETCAEAYADYYLHEETAQEASRLIVNAIKEYYDKYI